MGNLKNGLIRRYRVLDPFALPNSSIIVEKEGVGQFRKGDTMDEITFRRLGGRSLVLSGTIIEFHVQEDES